VDPYLLLNNLSKNYSLLLQTFKELSKGFLKPLSLFWEGKNNGLFITDKIYSEKNMLTHHPYLLLPHTLTIQNPISTPIILTAFLIAERKDIELHLTIQMI